MKKLILLLFVVSSYVSFSQCEGDYRKRLVKGDTLTVECTDMVLLNLDTYTAFWYQSNQLEELRKEYPKQMESLEIAKRLQDETQSRYDSLKYVRDKQVNLYEANRLDLERVIYKNESKIKRKNKGLKILTGVVILETLAVILLF